MAGLGLGVPPIQFGVGAGLFHHEYIDSQPQQLMERRDVEVGERPVIDGRVEGDRILRYRRDVGGLGAVHGR